MTDYIHIAELVTDAYHHYPAAFTEARNRWLEMIEDPDAGKEQYIVLITRHVEALDGTDIPTSDRAQLIIAAFWAASADYQLSEQKDRVEILVREMRTALNNIWGVDDGQ